MNANTINDPLYIASSDHPGIILTNTSFNDSNFHGWSRNIKMALASDLWKEIGERYGQSNGPLVYQLEKELSKITQGYPDWYKGKKAKKGNSGNVDQKLVAAVCHEMMKMFKGKGVMETRLLQVFSQLKQVYCHVSLHPFCTLFHIYNILLDWISDIGSSDHMSPHLNLFISTKNLKTPIIVHMPDGSSKTVTIVGQVQLNPSLILTDVFYVPDFQLNLLFVGKLIKHKQLAAYFYPNDFMFQDLTTKKIVAVGKGSQCLYICKPTLDQAAFDAQVLAFCKTYQSVISFSCLNKKAFSNSATKHSVGLKVFHERLGHNSVSKLVHIPQCKGLDVSFFLVNVACYPNITDYIFKEAILLLLCTRALI
ncbi:hypothetical protein Tco_0905391 [Tanacetum coccineum]